MKRMLIQVPTYSYLLLDAKTMEAVLNAPAYEYDWDKRVYWPIDVSDHTQVRVADESQIQNQPKPAKETVSE
jgi:hypothetical protein